MTNFVIEHQCPQCGAPAEFEETDRLFQCGFCRVTSYLTAPGYFRYVIPHNAPAGKDLVYFPYWRFKGMLFSCLPKRIENRFVDVSHQALELPNFPINIGFRGQTQKLRFAAAESRGVFVKPDTPFKNIFILLRKRYSMNLPKPVLHQEFIGETKSMIYAPFYFDGGIVDAVLNKSVRDAFPDDIYERLPPDRDRGKINFLPALCPQCGWNLDGERDSLVLLCDNCETAWWEKNQRLTLLKTAHFMQKGDGLTYLPFWRIQAEVTPLRLETYADLVRTANMPRVVKPGWENIPIYFWNPAFKVRPQSYLTIATNVTLNQPTKQIKTGYPRGTRYGVTLPLKEAVESLKLNLANFLRPREKQADLIPQIEIRPRRFILVYIPFKDTRLELVQPDLNLAVNKNILSLAKNL